MALSDAVPYVVAHWALDEASGTRNDSIGSNHLTDHNTVASGAGVFGTAADFESSNSEYLSATDSTATSTGDVDFMVRCIIKVESLASTGVVVCKGNNITDWTFEYAIYVDSGGNIYFRVSKNGVAITTATWSSTISTGTTYLVHGWHDSVNNLIGIALNAGTAVTTSWSGGVNDSTDDFRLGDDSTSRFYDGLIEDVVLMKGYILNATERTEDYNSGAFKAFSTWAGAAFDPGSGFPWMDFNRQYRQRNLVVAY